jgi:hypothetical protein
VPATAPWWIPREVLDAAGIAEGNEVSVAYDREQGGILAKPVRREVRGIDEQLVGEVNGFIDRYRPTLEALARHEAPHD